MNTYFIHWTYFGKTSQNLAMVNAENPRTAIDKFLSRDTSHFNDHVTVIVFIAAISYSVYTKNGYCSLQPLMTKDSTTRKLRK